jgi:uncharacterized membrane protein YphA (DoxX/SURF4 family)
MKPVVTISRIIVGVLFIFSGLIKADDPLGLSYKMQEFFEIWGMQGLYDYTLALSVLMIAFEIIAGVAVLVGWKMNMFSWLLLLLTIFFTFLTGYALFSGKVRECGCFGDCIPLTAQQSFIKDLVLLLLIILIFINRHKINAYWSARRSIIFLAVATFFAFGLQWYVLRYLPVVDCLPYRVGKNIPEQMKVPKGSIPDSTVITFVYEKQGKQIEFTADKFPDDFDDSVYHFIKRYDKLVRKGNAEIPIKDFVLLTAEGADSTKEIINYSGYQVFLFTKGMENSNTRWTDDYLLLHKKLKSKNIKTIIVTSDYDNTSSWMRKAGIGEGVSLFKSDFVAIKTAARADPTLYLIKNGTILNKWSYANFDKASTAIDAIQAQVSLLVK